MLKRGLTLALVAGASQLALASGAFAQEAGNTQVEEVVVTGVRASVSSAARSMYSRCQAAKPCSAINLQVRGFTWPVSRSRKSPMPPRRAQGNSAHSPQWASSLSRQQR